MAFILQPLVPFFRLTPLRNEWQDVELNTPLDDLYLNGDKTSLKHALKAFKKDGGLKGYRLSSHESIDKVMDEIAQLDPGQISPSLYESYSENLRKAVDQVFKKDNGNGLSDQLRANVSKFAAYKAYNATIDIQREMGNDWEDAKMVLRTYNRYQTTEYNTTISRCRTAKQFEQFNDPDNRRLFPNLRWLPSRSADPRESHMLFYDRVWSKDDEFWTKNTPGSLWNCKCDWEETDDPVTDRNPTTGKSMSGLKGNPAMTGDVFSIDHPYFSSSSHDSDLAVLRIVRKDCRNWCLKNLIGKSIKHKDLERKILISRRGIEEFINQPFDFYYEKNELLRRIDDAVKNSVYRGKTTSKGRISHIFETTISGKTAFVIANESDDTNIYIHSVTNSTKVLIGIQK